MKKRTVDDTGNVFSKKKIFLNADAENVSENFTLKQMF